VYGIDGRDLAKVPVLSDGGSRVPGVTDDRQPYAPPRPRSLDPKELGFVPQRPVPWLAPLQLIRTGLKTLGALLFGAYLDKRELQNALGGEWFDHSKAAGGEIWMDFVADLGDGFHPTYSVAYLLAQPELEVDGERLPRGRLLLMGGDETYPVASGDNYENRTKGPYGAALPEPAPDEPHPVLFTLPGNHDWYDGLTAFLRLFARRQDGHIGGWHTQQRRSYFAVRLPAGWWLFAIDQQFEAYIDDPQLQYFERAAREVKRGDRIILMTPSPQWVEGMNHPGGYDATDYFVRMILHPTGADVRVMLSGDLHHYARYTGPDRELLTCGGGGAYLLATHQLPEQITVPPEDTLTRHRSPARKYDLATRFPDKKASQRMSWGVFRRVPTRNPGFATMLGIIQTLTMLAMAGAVSQGGDIQRLFSIPLVIMLVLIMGGTILFAQPPAVGRPGHARHWILGILNGFAQIGLAVLGTWAWVNLPAHNWTWPGPLVVAAVVYGPIIGFLSTQLMALYLLIGGRWFGVNVNELFSGQGIEDAKSFLRMHIAADGTLTIHALGIDKICRDWVADPEAAPHMPWLRPREPYTVRHIEPPIVVPPTPPAQP
jgi:Calcineurin-like phosphoesterase